MHPSVRVVRLVFCALIILLLSAIYSARHSGKQASSRLYTNPSSVPNLIYHRAYSEGPRLRAQAAILVEASTGTILYAKNEHQARDPASITKVMTAIVAIERGDLSDRVIVTERATRVGGSSLHLRPGDEYVLEGLVRAMMLRSGNDGALAVAEHVGGTVEDFVAMMNARAASMGLVGTRFKNPHGLTAVGHLSSAFDLALMCMNGMRHPKFRDIVSTSELWYSDLDSQTAKVFQNTNRLLWSFAGADGVKTGTTSRAGHCLASSATRDGLQFVAVVLNSSSRWGDSAALLDYGFRTFTRLVLGIRGASIAQLLVDGGESESVDLVLGKDMEVVVRKSEASGVRVNLDIPERLEAPLAAGTKAGFLRAFYNDEEIAYSPLYVAEPVKRASLLRRVQRSLDRR